MVEENNPKKGNKIKIVKGASKDLQISEVKDSFTMETPEQKKKQNIVIPENVEEDKK